MLNSMNETIAHPSISKTRLQRLALEFAFPCSASLLAEDGADRTIVLML